MLLSHLTLQLHTSWKEHILDKVQFSIDMSITPFRRFFSNNVVCYLNVNQINLLRIFSYRLSLVNLIKFFRSHLINIMKIECWRTMLSDLWSTTDNRRWVIQKILSSSTYCSRLQVFPFAKKNGSTSVQERILSSNKYVSSRSLLILLTQC